MKYLLIDGNFFMYRAIHKMGKLKRSDGKDTGIEYGFLRMLKTTVDEIKPNKTYVVFDSGLSPQRLKYLPEYKANRSHKDKGAFDNHMLCRMLSALNIPCFQYNYFPEATPMKMMGVEADDIIGIVTKCIGYDDNDNPIDEELVIASSDTDFCQLISDNVKIYNPIKKEYLVSPVNPMNYTIYKGIIGDVADNIPGIKGIGPKKVLKKNLEGFRLGYDDGKSEWTNEESDIISRNEKIILIPDNIDDFSDFYPQLPIDDFSTKFDMWLNNEHAFPNDSCDFDLFFALCREMEFHSIESNRTSWQNTFGKRVTIDDLWQ